MKEGEGEAEGLRTRHGGVGFAERRDWEGGGQAEGSARGRFEEDLVRDRRVFVFVAASLTDALEGVSGEWRM